MSRLDEGVVPVSIERYCNFRYELRDNPLVDCITERITPLGDDNGNLVEGFKVIHLFVGAQSGLPAPPFSPQEITKFKSPDSLDEIIRSDGFNIQIWKFVVEANMESLFTNHDDKTTILKLGGTIKYHPGVFNLEDFETGARNSK